MKSFKIGRIFALCLVMTFTMFLPVRAQPPMPNYALPQTFNIHRSGSVLSWESVWGAAEYIVNFYRRTVGGRQSVGLSTSFDLRNLTIQDELHPFSFDYVEITAVNIHGIVFARSFALFNFNISPTTTPTQNSIVLYETVPFFIGGDIIDRPMMNVTNGPLIAFDIIGHMMGWTMNRGRTPDGEMWATLTSPYGLVIRIQNWHFVARINGEAVYMRSNAGVNVSARVHFNRFYVPIDFFNNNPLFPISIERFSGGLIVESHVSIQPPTVNPTLDLERRLLELTNIQRRNHGLPDLIWDSRLAAAARAHSEDMDRNNYFSHISHDGSNPWNRMARFGVTTVIATENIAWGQNTPESVVQSWMSQSHYRENILNASITHMGAGFSNNRWTQKFAALR